MQARSALIALSAAFGVAAVLGDGYDDLAGEDRNVVPLGAGGGGCHTLSSCRPRRPKAIEQRRRIRDVRIGFLEQAGASSH